LAQAIGQAAILQGYKVLYREVHILLDELSDIIADGTRKEYMASVATVPLLILDDFGMRKLPHTAAEDLLEIVMRRYERFSTLLTSNRPVEDSGKLLRDVAAVSAMLDRLQCVSSGFFVCTSRSRPCSELLTQLCHQIRHYFFRILRHRAAGLRYSFLPFTRAPRLGSFFHEFISIRRIAPRQRISAGIQFDLLMPSIRRSALRRA